MYRWIRSRHRSDRQDRAGIQLVVSYASAAGCLSRYAGCHAGTVSPTMLSHKGSDMVLPSQLTMHPCTALKAQPTANFLEHPYPLNTRPRKTNAVKPSTAL